MKLAEQFDIHVYWRRVCFPGSAPASGAVRRALASDILASQKLALEHALFEISKLIVFVCTNVRREARRTAPEAGAFPGNWIAPLPIPTL